MPKTQAYFNSKLPVIGPLGVSCLLTFSSSDQATDPGQGIDSSQTISPYNVNGTSILQFVHRGTDFAY